MSIIDFPNSYLTFFTKAHQGGNIARIQIDAAATIEGTTYYLIAPCRSEFMYLDGPLFQMPNYEFCGVFTADQAMIVRTHWTSDRDNREIASPTERFDHTELAIRHVASPDALPDNEAVVAATLANCPLVARTAIQDQATGREAILEYPVKTMNVTRDPPRFQVDTGPLLVPDFASTAAHPIERLDIAHVVYHLTDRAEFVVRRPHQVGEHDGQPARVTDYTEIVTFAARNEVFAG